VAVPDRLRTGIALACMNRENRVDAEMKRLSSGQPGAERPQPSSLRVPQVFCKQVLMAHAQK